MRVGGFKIAEKNDEYIIVKEAIDSAMLERLLQFLKRKRPRAAKMKNEGGDSDDERKARYDDRDSAVSWFSAARECEWFHDRLVRITQDVANVQWPILNTGADGKLTCEFEKCQYAVYGQGQHFNAWHQDAFEEGHDPEDARQITIVVMLSDRKAYKGGHFQAKVINSAGRKVQKKLKMGAGDCVVFPAKKLVHRVLPVESGIRKTIVFWSFDRASCIQGREELAKQKQLPHDTPLSR